MTDLESVNENKDELLFDLLDNDNSSDNKENNNHNNGNNAGAAAVPPPAACVICKISTDLSVIYTVCKHLNTCQECYDSYLASERAKYEEDYEGREGVIPPFIIQCPSCRTPHDPHQIIAGVFKP